MPTDVPAFLSDRKPTTDGFGPQEICNITLQNVDDPVAYEECVALTTAMNLTVTANGIETGNDGISRNSTTAAKDSIFCASNTPFTHECFESICQQKWTPTCYSKLMGDEQGSAVSTRIGDGGWKVSLALVVAMGITLL